MWTILRPAIWLVLLILDAGIAYTTDATWQQLRQESRKALAKRA